MEKFPPGRGDDERKRRMKKMYVRPIMHLLQPQRDSSMSAWQAMDDHALTAEARRRLAEEESMTYRTTADVVVRKIGDEWVLVPTGELARRWNGMVTLNRTGLFVWEQFSRPCSLRRVLQAARDHFVDTGCRRMDTEIRNLVEEYAQRALLVQVKR